MSEDLRKVAKHTAIYGLGGASGRLAAFLLIPVYTRYLTPTDYGILAMTGMVSFVLHIVFSLGMYSALFKSYFETNDEAERQVVVTTGLVFLITYSGVLSLALFAVSRPVSSFILKSAAYSYLVKLVVITTFFDVCAIVPFAVLRARERAAAYSFFTFLKLLLGLGLAIFFVVVLGRNVAGVLESTLITSILVAVVLMYATSRQVSLRFSAGLLRRMLSFGVPLMPSGLAIWILTLSDRYFLEHFSGLHEVGLYSLGYRFGMVLNIALVSPFIVAWAPLMLSVAKREDCREIYSNVLTYFSLIAFFVTLAISVLAKDVIELMATPPFYSAFRVVFLIALSYVLYGLYMIFTLGTTLTRHTQYVPFLTGSAAVMNIGLNFCLIPRYGMMGAAVATVLSYCCMALVQFFVSQRLYPVAYQLNRVLKVAGTTIVIYVLSLYVETGHTMGNVAVRTALICMFWPIVYALRFFTQQETTKIREFLRHPHASGWFRLHPRTQAASDYRADLQGKTNRWHRS